MCAWLLSGGGGRRSSVGSIVAACLEISQGDFWLRHVSTHAFSGIRVYITVLNSLARARAADRFRTIL